MEDLPTDYDAIVVGTGLVESIYAAAAARIGKTVLHIDRNTHYSGEWAVLGLTGLLDWVAHHTDGQETQPAPSPAEAEPGPSRPLRHHQLVHGVTQHWYIEEGDVLAEDPPRQRSACSGSSNDDTSAPVPETTTECTTESSALAESSSEASAPNAMTATTSVQSKQQLAEAGSSEMTDSSGTHEEPAETPVGPSEQPKESSEVSAEPSVPSGEAGSEPAASSSSESVPLGAQPASKKSPEWTINWMKKLTRRFNIDLAPKVLYSRGALVELLISSSIARYAEFRSVGQLLTPLQGQLQPVPSSRADVFTTKHVSVVEKRLLMKLLSFCAEFEKNPEEYKGYEEKPFSDFLRARRLTDNLTHHVTHAIAMVTPQTPTLEALRSTQKFLRSLGRYGNTPFLWPMYGSGEIPQCFCRLCAVFGGVYHLSRGVEAITVDGDGQLTGAVSDGQQFTCRRLVLEEAYREDTGEMGASGGVSRAVLITDGPLYGAAGDQVLLIRLPASEDHPGPVTVLQVGPAASTAPAGLFVVHLTCASRGSAEEDLSPAVTRLQQLTAASGGDQDGDGGPAAPLNVLYALYFSRRCGGPNGDGSALPESVAFCSGPDDAIGFDAAVQEARDLFNAHFPGEEFLPRAPDPEEIIFFDEPTESVVTGGAQPTTEGSSGGEGQQAQGEGAAEGGTAEQAAGDTAAAALGSETSVTEAASPDRSGEGQTVPAEPAPVPEPAAAGQAAAEAGPQTETADGC